MTDAVSFVKVQKLVKLVVVQRMVVGMTSLPDAWVQHCIESMIIISQNVMCSCAVLRSMRALQCTTVMMVVFATLIASHNGLSVGRSTAAVEAEGRKSEMWFRSLAETLSCLDCH